VFHDPYSLLANIAHGERERSVVARLCGKSLGYRELTSFIEGPRRARLGVYGNTPSSGPAQASPALILEPIDRVVERLETASAGGGDQLRVYLDNLFRLLSAGNPPSPPTLLIYSGDAMTDTESASSRTGFAFRSTALQRREAFKIGFSCEEGAVPPSMKTSAT